MPVTALTQIHAECTAGISQDYPVSPVDFTLVKITDDFWRNRIETNRRVTLPYAFKKCEETGRIANFEKAAGINNDGKKSPCCFDDSDVFKLIEGAAFSLGAKPDPELEKYMDSLIDKIGAAQEPDGYLYTDRTMTPDDPHPWAGKKRWEKESELSHELYNVGHMYEAAVAYYIATGKRKFLDICIKNANLVDKDFGPGKLTTWPGHQVIEMGLVKLYRTTGDERYLRLAKFFLDTRGPGGDEYGQAHRKVVEQKEAVGHAVRGTYMYSGMADIAALTGDKSYLNAIDAIWEDVVGGKLYVTGGIGSRHSGEAFGDKYELPNMSAYCETCASIANVFWNHRLFLLHGDAKYIDVLERSLYNSFLSGISLEGDKFFYPNPLLSMGQHERSPWFGCSCCPTNVSRFMPSVPGYMYAVRGGMVYVNLYARSSARIAVNGGELRISQETRYPWDGRIELKVNSDKAIECTLALRIPGWAVNRPVPSDLYSYIDERKPETAKFLKVNGASQEVELEKGFALVRRTWKDGDTILLDLPMPIRKITADSRVEEDKGMIALERGPIVYCLEWPDNADGHVLNMLIDDSSNLASEHRPGLLGGITVITGKAKTFKRRDDGNGMTESEGPFTAIPYYSWAHRGPGEMTVWIPNEKHSVRPLPRKTIASTSKIKVSGNLKSTIALFDQLPPKSSNDHSMPFMHWWPRKGTVEWVEYHFEKAQEVSRSRIYWFDDRPWGGCRVPKSWKLLYRSGDEWMEVKNPSGYETKRDGFNQIDFSPVSTDALRLEIQLGKEVSAGMLEWEVE